MQQDELPRIEKIVRHQMTLVPKSPNQKSVRIALLAIHAAAMYILRDVPRDNLAGRYISFLSSITDPSLILPETEMILKGFYFATELTSRNLSDPFAPLDRIASLENISKVAISFFNKLTGPSY